MDKDSKMDKKKSTVNNLILALWLVIIIGGITVLVAFL